jgi:adenylosuccinate lyase
MDLQVNKNRMLANIRATNGLVHAEAVMLMLAKTLGKQSAYQLIHEVSLQAQKEEIHFKQALTGNPTISAILTRKEIDLLFDLEQSTGMCANMVDQVISQCRRI